MVRFEAVQRIAVSVIVAFTLTAVLASTALSLGPIA